MRVFAPRWLRSALLLALLAALPVIASAKRQERLIDSWRPVKFSIDLRFDEKLTTLSTATTTVIVRVLKDGTRSIDFDFGELTVDSVTVAGKPVSYGRRDNRLIVELPALMRAGTEVEISVRYHGRPQDGLIFSRDRDGQPTAVGDNWPDRVHYWIPCLDHPSAKAPVSYTITAPGSNLVVANGAQIGNHANVDRTVTWTFSEPAPVSPYNMIVAVAPFAHGSIPGPVPLAWYVPKYEGAFAPDGFAPAPVAVQQFSETIAPFPYPKLALIVGATKFGGMENAGAIVFTTTLFKDFASTPRESVRFKAPTNVIDVVAHEVAHQWFGDSVTEATWADLWLSEGFATYFAGLFRERTEGKESFRAYMDEAAMKYFAYEKSQRTPLHDTETDDLMALLNANNYQKGAWVLHMLRGQLGDRDFFAGLKIYYADHKDGVATTGDLRSSLEKASGKDLREFFRQWVYGTGHPNYSVTWGWTGRPGKAGTVVLDIHQTQVEGAFTTPFTVEFALPGGVRRQTVTPEGKTLAVRIPLPSEPTAIRIDPDGFILKSGTQQRIRVQTAGR